MIVTDNDEYAQRLSRLRSHGMTSLTWDRHKGHAWSYDVVDLGYNYRIDEIRAALGRVQLEKLPVNNEHRRRLTRVYRETLRELAPQVEIPFEEHPGLSAAHLLPILLPAGMGRSYFMDNLKAQGIQTSIHYPPIHTFSAYKDSRGANCLPHTDDVGGREVTLPLYPTLTDDDALSVARAIAQTFVRF
jgi:dTDP-4-amino-4,6-dideoxygalactose transaminase